MGTTTPAKPRPTRAALDEAERRADEALAEADALRVQLQLAEFERDSWRAERLDVPEAEALARCVRAIDSILFPGAERAVRTAGDGTINVGTMPAQISGGISWHTSSSPSLIASVRRATVDYPVGRILLHLAAIFDVPLDAAEAEELEPAERCDSCHRVLP